MSCRSLDACAATLTKEHHENTSSLLTSYMCVNVFTTTFARSMLVAKKKAHNYFFLTQNEAC